MISASPSKKQHFTGQWPGCTTVLPEQGEVRINAAFFRKFDFSSATVRLIASVPGYHQGHNLSKWGHMKLRKVLQEQSFEQEFKGAPIVYQVHIS
jgi:tyrosyl-DNA phosphodiesterase-1